MLNGEPVVEESDEELAAAGGMSHARILPDIALDDPAYKGVRSSRKEVFQETNDFEPAGSLDGSGPSSSGEDGSDGDEPGDILPGPQEDEEVAALEREVAELEANEGDAAAHLAQRAQRERRKAMAVHAQRRVWEAGLELRILVQRLLKAAARMPQGVMREAAVAHDAELAEGLREVQTESVGLANDLVGVLGALQSNHPAIAEEPPRRKRKPALSSTALWHRMDDWYTAIKPFQDTSIDRWQRKTLVAGGSLKALNQPVSTQVSHLMLTSDAIIQRTQLACDQVAVIGRPPSSKVQVDGSDADRELERDPETYDDTEFYSTLLNEFLESSNAPALASKMYTGAKKRKLVDRRASKGRKIRYHVQEKLVNFMTPQESGSTSLASQLFGNLFGVSI